jgi:hypothetical protein
MIGNQAKSVPCKKWQKYACFAAFGGSPRKNKRKPGYFLPGKQQFFCSLPGNLYPLHPTRQTPKNHCFWVVKFEYINFYLKNKVLICF